MSTGYLGCDCITLTRSDALSGYTEHHPHCASYHREAATLLRALRRVVTEASDLLDHAADGKEREVHMRRLAAALDALPRSVLL